MGSMSTTWGHSAAHKKRAGQWQDFRVGFCNHRGGPQVITASPCEWKECSPRWDEGLEPRDDSQNENSNHSNMEGMLRWQGMSHWQVVQWLYLMAVKEQRETLASWPTQRSVVWRSVYSDRILTNWWMREHFHQGKCIESALQTRIGNNCTSASKAHVTTESNNNNCTLYCMKFTKEVDSFVYKN